MLSYTEFSVQFFAYLFHCVGQESSLACHGERGKVRAMTKTNVIGIDLGGTKCAVGRFDATTWAKIDQKVVSTAGKSFDVIMKELVECVRSMDDGSVRAAGIGVPGLIRQPQGILLKAPNIEGSDEIPVKDILTKELGMPVFVSNDANCFTLAEAIMGEGKGKGSVIGITFGTGVGGGIVIDGKVFEGAHGFAAEIGHMLMVPGQPPYETTDKRGEVEQFLSGTAMGKRCEEASSPEDYLEGAVCSFMQPQIYREVAWLCTNLTHLLDPDIIIFGGSAGHALLKHVDRIEAELRRWMLPGAPLPEIAAAKTRDAGMLGAALLCK